MSDVESLLRRIRDWDMLDACADGPYWKAEIDAVLHDRRGVDGDNRTVIRDTRRQGAPLGIALGSVNEGAVTQTGSREPAGSEPADDHHGILVCLSEREVVALHGLGVLLFAVAACEGCGDSFVPRNGHQRFCQTRCAARIKKRRQRARNRLRVCSECGSRYAQSDARQTTCSRNCTRRRRRAIKARAERRDAFAVEVEGIESALTAGSSNGASSEASPTVVPKWAENRGSL